MFRGDNVCDEEGLKAVLSEQDSSSAHMAASKIIDAIAHMPGNAGEDSDAVGAYTQVRLSEATRLLGIGVIPDTYITLPQNRRPSNWKKFKNPCAHCSLISTDAHQQVYYGIKAHRKR